MSNRPSLSVVITCYSEGDLLFEAVESVLQQTCPPLEIIVVNDAATDPATNEVCRKLEQNPAVQVIWQAQNGGPTVARNRGFAAAQGEVLVPLDADDLLPPKALQHIAAAFAQHPDAGFIHGSYIRLDQPGVEQRVEPGDVRLRTMLRSRPWSVSSAWTLIGTAPLRKWLWQAVEQGDPTFGAADLHDLEFWIRAITLPCQYDATVEVIYIWRKYLGKNSRRVTPMSWYRIAQKHFDTYCAVGLDYRAYELLLLGSKWNGDAAEIWQYSYQLLACILRGRCQFSSVVALLLPGFLLRPLARYRARRR